MILRCISLLILIDLVKDALQPNFQHVEDSRLKALLQDLPAVLLKSKAANTNKKYEKGFKVSLYSFFWTIPNIFISPFSKLPGLGSILNLHQLLELD